MKDVNFRSVRAIAEALSALKGVPVAEILPPEQADRGWISWENFVTWIDGLNQSSLAPIDWQKAGEACHESPSFPAMQGLLRSTFSIRFCYWIISAWFGPASFPLLKSDYQELPLGQIRIRLEIPGSHRRSRYECQSIFLLFKGSLAVMPTKIFGLPASRTESKISGVSAEYLITPPVQFTLWSRLRFSIGGMFSPKNLLAELAFQQQHLKEQTEEALRSQAEFRALIEHSPDGIFIHKSGLISYVNPRMADYLGYDEPTQLIGLQALDIVHPDSRVLVQERIESLRTGRTTVNPSREMKFLRRDSAEPFYAEAVELKVTWEGQPATAVTVRDLSDRKRLQAHLMLIDRMMALGVLAAGVGHEVNNPLGYVLLNLEALKNNLKSNPRNEISVENSQHLADMEKGLERIRLIVRDLKVFSRGSDENARAPVSLQAVLLSVISMARKETESRAQLHFEQIELPRVHASEARLGQVFLNLLLNASQSIEPGKPEANQISVRTMVVKRNLKSWVAVEIADTGAGMNEETQKRLFEPFFTTKPVGVGTGLGLSICHSIIEGFGGVIELESKLGKGTTFRVLLPTLEDELRVTSKTQCSEPVQDESTGRVLIIDDDQALLEMTDFFISEDHETVALSDAREAIALLERGEEFDCILCDLMMPTLNGIQFYQRLSEVSPRHLSRIIYVTGGSFTEETHMFLSRPEIQHIEKPFETARLRKLVQDRVWRALAERA